MPIFAIMRLLKLVKKHWKPIVVVVGLGALTFLYVTGKSDWLRQFDELKKVHSEEIEQIEKARADELVEHKRVEEELKRQLNDIKAQYEQREREIAARRQHEVTRIVKEYNGNPRGLADELSNMTGFRVVNP